MLISSLLTTIVAFCINGIAAQDSTPIGGLSGSHTDVPRWCGKPYEKGSTDFGDPGGKLKAPQPSAGPLLHVKVEPRHSIYDSSEDHGEIIIDATTSHLRWRPVVSESFPWPNRPHRPNYFQKIDFIVKVEGTDIVLLSDKVALNTTDNIFQFCFDDLEPRLEPYTIVLHATSTHEFHKGLYTATSSIYYLPAKNSGSTVKIDNLYGGMLVANNHTHYAFEPFLPFGFYTSCSGYLNYSLANVTAYQKYGFNAINPVCAFTDGDLGFLFDWMDSANLWYQYDMRGSYLNLTQVEEQIPLIKDRSNLLSWYTADEPDGWQYALNSTRLAYDLLKKEDPYHPTALVLNCQNYYFEEYTSGTDYIMQDAYPVSIDPTYSRSWDTPVNDTYGDCGCDNCFGILQDVSDRLDDFQTYQSWLSRTPKPLWSVLQAFSGENYWTRDPSPTETWVMMILSFNHKAKAIMSWTFPASSVLEKAHGEMARVVTTPEVSRFLIGADPVPLKVEDHPLVDVAYWVNGKQVMLAIASLDVAFANSTIEIDLPHHATRIASQPWGSLSWSLDEDGKLKTCGLDDYDTSILILDC